MYIRYIPDKYGNHYRISIKNDDGTKTVFMCLERYETIIKAINHIKNKK